MIVYFINRDMKIVGQASTMLPKGMRLTEDLKTDEIETGVATFQGKIPYSNETREACEKCVAPGNFVLRSNGDEGEAYTIIEVTTDTEEMTVEFYAEDAGLDLLNEVAISLPDGEFSYRDATMTEFVNLFIDGTGWEINPSQNDSAGDTTKKPPKFSESTVTARLKELGELFGYEVSYSFKIDDTQMSITHKYVNIYKKRGKDDSMRLALNREVSKISAKKTIANTATSLLVYGPDSKTIPDSYVGRTYENGEYVVANQYFAARGLTHPCLQSKTALSKWGRNVSGDIRHITKTLNVDTEDADEMIKAGIKELKKIGDAEVNYEIDIDVLPENVRIGDLIYIVDEIGELYLQARVLKLETSETSGENKVTLGDYLIKDGGISETVRTMAASFEEMAKQRKFYTWIAYADDAQGTGISLSPINKTFIGIAVNQTVETPDITNPSVYSWVEIVADKLVAVDLQITSSAGQVFITTKVETTLTAHVYLQGDELTAQQIADIGVIRWYKDGVQTQVTGTTYTITAADNIDAASMSAQLEVEVN